MNDMMITKINDDVDNDHDVNANDDINDDVNVAEDFDNNVSDVD